NNADDQHRDCGNSSRFDVHILFPFWFLLKKTSGWLRIKSRSSGEDTSLQLSCLEQAMRSWKNLGKRLTTIDWTAPRFVNGGLTAFPRPSQCLADIFLGTVGLINPLVAELNRVPSETANDFCR